jgi:hypothetical protein
VQGDDESPSEDWSQNAAVITELFEEEARGRLMAGVWWRPIPW